MMSTYAQLWHDGLAADLMTEEAEDRSLDELDRLYDMMTPDEREEVRTRCRALNKR